jgi:hypothetical protein
MIEPIANSNGSGSGSYLGNNGSPKPHYLQSDPQFKRPDHQIYISNLPQKAGVPYYQIRKLVLKELADNSLDEMDTVGKPGLVKIDQDAFADNVYTFTDQGRGIPGTPKEIARIFSCDKPMTSSKQLRKPTRGCVGNGLRVIVGSVASGGGRIIVKTYDREITLRPRLNGTTDVEQYRKIDWPVGTSITIEIDPKYPIRGDTMDWAKLAITLAKNSDPPFYRQPSVHWYDQRHLAFSILAGSPPKYTLRELVSRFDRCTGREIQQRVTERFGKGRLCQDMNQEEAGTLLSILREGMAAIKPKKLGPMGENAWKHEDLTDGYACEEGTLEIRGTPGAEIPFLVEVWAATCETPEDVDDDEVYPVNIIGFTINRSPAIASFSSEREGRSRDASLTLGQTVCDLELRQGPFDFALNITSPYVPILSDNKSPDLTEFKVTICTAVEKAIGRAARNNPPDLVSRVRDDDDDDDDGEEDKPEKVIQKTVILEAIPEGIKHCSSNREGETVYEFDLRELYYAVRKMTVGRIRRKLRNGEIKNEVAMGYFSSVLGDYENEHGQIALMNRHTRGSFISPHGGQSVSMGTKSVAAYQRPPWLYSNVLFVEKESFVALLEQVGFQDRWDCFIMTAQGFCTRAGKDLIDKIAAKDEPTLFFSVLDGDASGGVIHDKLVEATKARGARKVKVIPLGFFPWECRKEGLPSEPSDKSDRRKAVAQCVKDRDAVNKANGNPDGEPVWETWLQRNRYELNVMTPQEFIDWITSQFEKHGVTKTIPPEELALETVTESVREKVSKYADQEIRSKYQDELEALQKLADELEDKIGEEAGQIAEERMDAIEFPEGYVVVEQIKDWLEEKPQSHWRKSIDDVSLELIPEDERPDPEDEDEEDAIDDIADDIAPEGQEEDEEGE